MDWKKVALAAIKQESKNKQEEKIWICGKLITYRELVERLEKGDPEVEQFILKPYVEALKRTPAFRIQVLAMLGISE